MPLLTPCWALSFVDMGTPLPISSSSLPSSSPEDISPWKVYSGFKCLPPGRVVPHASFHLSSTSGVRLRPPSHSSSDARVADWPLICLESSSALPSCSWLSGIGLDLEAPATMKTFLLYRNMSIRHLKHCIYNKLVEGFYENLKELIGNYQKRIFCRR